jgi:hypothetical protein
MEHRASADKIYPVESGVRENWLKKRAMEKTQNTRKNSRGIVFVRNWSDDIGVNGNRIVT